MDIIYPKQTKEDIGKLVDELLPCISRSAHDCFFLGDWVPFFRDLNDFLISTHPESHVTQHVSDGGVTAFVEPAHAESTFLGQLKSRVEVQLQLVEISLSLSVNWQTVTGVEVSKNFKI